MEERLAHAFEAVLQRANYTRLSEADLEGAFATESLIPLKTNVDFDDYERVIFYYRGDNFKTITIKHLVFWRKEMVVDNLERVALMLKFKDAAHFEAKKMKIEELNFEPGKMYLYIYKNIPRFDLELLFPNVKVSMNWRDRIMFVVPAIGSAVALVGKVLPSLVIIFVTIVALLFGASAAASWFNVDTNVDDLAALTAILSITMTLGGFAYKQYSDYTKKRTQFLKKVTETLFFKNLVTNQGVLYTLIDAAEEEECKEILLVYYHLLTSDTPLTAQQLDDHIEVWMEQNLDARIDFDIHKTLENLANMQAPVASPDGDGTTTDKALLSVTPAGEYQALPIDDAKAVLDYIWDNIFHYPIAPDELAPGQTKKTAA
jgi:hypothetical protein